jgi:hypothetical protein
MSNGECRKNDEGQLDPFAGASGLYVGAHKATQIDDPCGEKMLFCGQIPTKNDTGHFAAEFGHAKNTLLWRLPGKGG